MVHTDGLCLNLRFPFPPNWWPSWRALLLLMATVALGPQAAGADPLSGPALPIEPSPGLPKPQAPAPTAPSAPVAGTDPQSPLALSQWPTLNGLLTVPPWLNLALSVQGDGFVNPSGGLLQGRNWIQQTTLEASLSSGFGKEKLHWSELDHWQVHAALAFVNGVAGYGQRIGAAFPLSFLDSPTGFWITEASIERIGGAVDVKAGAFSLDPGFVDAPVLASYLNTVFNDVLNLNQPGLPINPYVAPGIELHWRPAAADPTLPGDSGALGEWHYAAYLLDPSLNVSATLGVVTDQPSFEGHVQALQWRFDRLPGARRLVAPIHHRGQFFARMLPAPLLQLGGGYVAQASNNQFMPMLFGSLTLAPQLPIGLDNRIWLGFNGGNEVGGNPVTLFGSGGWLCQGLIVGRPFDVLALGFGRSSFNQQLLAGLQPQSLVELNYSFNLNSSLSIQPVLQWIQAPASVGSILALALQVQLQF
jgi:porin